MSWKWALKQEEISKQQKFEAELKKLELQGVDVSSKIEALQQEHLELLSAKTSWLQVSGTLLSSSQAEPQSFSGDALTELKKVVGLQESSATAKVTTVQWDSFFGDLGAFDRAARYGEPYVEAIKLLYRAMPKHQQYPHLDSSVAFTRIERRVMGFNDNLPNAAAAAAWFRRALELTM